MRLSIRDQILIPLLGIQAVAVTAIAVSAAALAAARSEREIVARINGVIETLEHASFPYTARVLAQMRGLSGAQFVTLTNDGRVTGSTLDRGVETLPAELRALRPRDRLASLGESPTFLIRGDRYFAVPIRSASGARPSTLLVLYSEASWRQARQEAATLPLALGLGTLCLMAAVTGWIAQSIAVRIRRVQQQVARIAGGDFAPFEPGTRRDEIQDLARSINAMCEQLKQMQHTIQQSERTRVLAQLGAGLAHQLRNSLTGARLSVQLHAKRSPPRPGDETLDVALRQLAMTEEQVKGLLSLGRLEQRPPAACDVGALVADVALLVGPSCQHAGVALRVCPANGPLLVTADAAGLRAAVLNLALNAIEAAGPGGTVEVDATAARGEVAVEVRDTGPGPSPQVAENLLEAFVTSKPEGVGLGLAIAHHVAVEHGGRVSWSRTNGQTHFRLALPATDATPGEMR